jgi:hypothetical protein
MPVSAMQSLSEGRYSCDVICSVPAGAAGERMVAYGANFGRGTSRVFSRLDGKTLLITDLTATSVAQKEIKFKRSDFANGNAPTLAEIVAAINAVLVLDVTPTVASAGPQGELVISSAATSATGGLTIGAGTANVLLGFPKGGVFFTVVNGTGITITFPAGISREYLYGHVPTVDLSVYTPATAVRAYEALYTAVYTPSARTLLIANAGGVARVTHIRVSF